MLLEIRYGLSGIRYGRIASSVLFDGKADALLLIGDEALQARAEGIKGMPFMTDLGEEWFQWQGVPFVFARWMVRCGLRQEVKDIIENAIHKSLRVHEVNKLDFAQEEASRRPMRFHDVLQYWNGFAYELTPEHQRSIALFSELLEKTCLTA
jgi:chorismate dehydratase